MGLIYSRMEHAAWADRRKKSKAFRRRFRNPRLAAVRSTGMRYRRDLRRKYTPAESRLAETLGSLRISFEFQKVFTFDRCPRIVDFFVRDGFIAIEADGKSHFTEEGRKSDALRSRQFRQSFPYIKFLRFSNQEVFQSTFTGILLRRITELRYPDSLS